MKSSGHQVVDGRFAKKIRILIVGFGSIGKRHFNNLKNLGFNGISVYDLNLSSYRGWGANVVDNLSLSKLKEFDLVFICTPSHLHLKVATLVAKAGCDFFVEKPLSHNLDGIKKLKRSCHGKKLVSMVGCNMRFHPALVFIKKYLEAGKLGKVYSIKHEFGYYLPFWREGQDYRENYAVKKETGGGIILDDIHEFDLLFWLNNFEPVLDYKIISGNSGVLEIETEDQAVGVFKFRNGVFGSVRCDYLSKKYVRTCEIVGERGNLFWDFNNNDVVLSFGKNKKKIFSLKKYDTNQMYLAELEYFLGQVRKKEETFNNLDRAKQVLSYCLKHD